MVAQEPEARQVQEPEQAVPQQAQEREPAHRPERELPAEPVRLAREWELEESMLRERVVYHRPAKCRPERYLVRGRVGN